MTTLSRPPAGLVRLNGALVPRRRGFVQPRQLTCRNGHKVRVNAVVREDCGLRCTKLRCDAIVYVLYLRPAPGLAFFFAADATYEELDHWQQERFTVAQVLGWLGADLPEGQCRAS